MTTLASPISSVPTRWWIASETDGHSSATSSAMRWNDDTASGSYASYSSRSTRRPRLSPRTTPRNVTTAARAALVRRDERDEAGDVEGGGGDGESLHGAKARTRRPPV